MKIFLDTDILIDWLDKRPGFEEAQLIIESNEKDDFTRVYTSFLSIADIAYIMRKKPREDILEIIKALTHNINILPSDDSILHRLDEFKSPDIEDCMQIKCAEMWDCDTIITNNTSHFLGYTGIPVMTAREFVSMCG